MKKPRLEVDRDELDTRLISRLEEMQSQVVRYRQGDVSAYRSLSVVMRSLIYDRTILNKWSNSEGNYSNILDFRYKSNIFLQSFLNKSIGPNRVQYAPSLYFTSDALMYQATENSNMISLDKWLSEEVVWGKYTVQSLIKEIANRDMAHVLPEISGMDALRVASLDGKKELHSIKQFIISAAIRILFACEQITDEYRRLFPWAFSNFDQIACKKHGKTKRITFDKGKTFHKINPLTDSMDVVFKLSVP